MRDCGCAFGIFAARLVVFDRVSNRVALGVDDETRTEPALKGAANKRLTYRGPHSPEVEIPF
jgi:hypothetical protein